jgi:hypothetical protein
MKNLNQQQFVTIQIAFNVHFTPAANEDESDYKTSLYIGGYQLQGLAALNTTQE